jgi:CSLREA domain-containing protein
VGSAGIVTAVPVAAASETFVVRSLGDKPDSDPGDGVCATAGSGSAARRCTLRAAIMEANATPDQDRVRFAIENGTSSWKTIKPTSALPVISAPLVIDGSTQAGATDNTSATGTNARMRVILVGSQAGNAAGLQASAKVTIRGLVIDRFARGIQLSAGSDGSRVLGTFVGTDRTGRQARGNHGSGILVNAADVHIGSAARADRNLVSGNDSAGISLGIAARRATVQGNLIGTRSDGTSPLGNGADGVFVTGSRDHLIGGEAPGEGNIIGWNGGDGVSLLAIDSLDLVPRSVRILGNSISHDDRLGIDLGADGSTANDPVPDTDGGPNRLQNKPRVIGAVAGATRTTITGSLASRRGQAYRIEVFQSAAGDAEGRAYLGSLDVTTGADGRASWTFRIRARLALGTTITATATDISRSETSEFSPARTVTGS